MQHQKVSDSQTENKTHTAPEESVRLSATPQQTSHAVSSPVPTFPFTSAQNQGQTPLLLGLVALFGFLIMAGIGWYSYTVLYPNYLVKKFVAKHIEIIRDKEYSRAYEQTTSGFKLEYTQENYQKYVDSQGLSHRDIPAKIVKAKAFTAERDLTKQGEVLVELKGDSGVIQPVRIMIVNQLGDYKIRLIELPGETNPGSWIGVRYEHEKLGIHSSQTETTAPTTATVPETNLEVNTMPAVETTQNTAPATTTAPAQNAPATNTGTTTTTNSPFNVQTAPQDSTYRLDVISSSNSWTKVAQSDPVVLSAQVAAEQHLGFVRFPTEETVKNAIAQLHPSFKANVTAQQYVDWLNYTGITSKKSLSVETGTIDVRTNGTYYIGKVEFLLRDFSTTDGSTMPIPYRVYVGVIGMLDEYKSIPWRNWYVISFFTETVLQKNPSFFPF